MADRLGTCVDCSAEFVAATKGAVAKRCTGCGAIHRNQRVKALAWNKVRYKETVGRKENVRRWRLITKYGITPEDWDAMYAAQDEACAICRQSAEEMVGGLHVDHCHTTGVVRGLLCQSCNTSIGKMKEDPAIIRAAADYVERHLKVSRG